MTGPQNERTSTSEPGTASTFAVFDERIQRLRCKNRMRRVAAFLLSVPAFSASAAEQLNYGPLPFPEVNPDTWVLIEYWPTVKDITLSAYFMDFSSEKNRNLCGAAKKAIDRDAAAQAKQQGISATAYRKCYTLRDAIANGYIERPTSTD